MMKIEESIKMVSQEVPYIFGIAAQVFIEEITIRAWIYTKESNRKIITADDVIKALKNTSKYDFLYFLLIEDNQKL
ncbi:NFYC [Hepatospora eriocheir]|nr:NFYC [Hepatospora eriocheir]